MLDNNPDEVISVSILRELTDLAIDAQKNAYVPYSGFSVGTALITQSGEKFRGCNVENAAYPLGACAESNAIAAMVCGASGDADHVPIIDHIVVVGPLDNLCAPCGGCRQKINEFADANTRVHLVNKSGKLLHSSPIQSLLPLAFGPHDLSLNKTKNYKAKKPQ